MKNMTVIPPKPQKGNAAAKEEVKRLRVAAYCRVSTDNEEQASSYEAQIQHYEKFIKTNPEWEHGNRLRIKLPKRLSGDSREKAGTSCVSNSDFY